MYGNFGQANYAAAKLGILGLGNTLAREGEKRGVLVNTIVPIAASRMTESLLPPDLLAALRPEAVAPLVTLLAHEKCPVNGAVFELGAGWISQLRWERSKGAYLGSAEAGWTPEAVQAKWKDIADFSPSVVTHPESNTAAFEAIMKLVNAAPKAPSSSASSASTAGGSFLPSLPGGRTGVSASVDAAAAVAHEFPPETSSYTQKDAILYALSLGAGAKGPGKGEEQADALLFTYEMCRDGACVFVCVNN